MLEQFCKSIIQLEVENSKALANLVMGLGSSPRAKSVVELSLSPCYHYQHSSINKAVDKLHGNDSLKEDENRIARLNTEKKFVYQKGLFRKAV